MLIISIKGYSQYGMAQYEEDMLFEYSVNDINSLTNYIVYQANLLEPPKEIIINEKLYKFKVQPLKKAEKEEYRITLSRKRKYYVFNIRGNKVELYSDNLTFFATYNFENKEVKILSNQSNKSASDFKMYGYIYKFDTGNLEKIEDWVIRDAVSRAYSREQSERDLYNFNKKQNK